MPCMCRVCLTTTWLLLWAPARRRKINMPDTAEVQGSVADVERTEVVYDSSGGRHYRCLYGILHIIHSQVYKPVAWQSGCVDSWIEH